MPTLKARVYSEMPSMLPAMSPHLPCRRSPKHGKRPGERPLRGAAGRRPGLITAALLVVAITVGDRADAAQPLRLRCTNPASGTSWQLLVDLDRHRVGSLPATITDQWVQWRDPKEGSYDLERASGRLQLRNASSTGGYFLYYSCRAEPN